MTTDTDTRSARQSTLSQVFIALVAISIFGYVGGISLAVAALLIH